MGAAQQKQRHIFSTDLPTIESEIRSLKDTVVSADKTEGNAILEIGKRLAFVKSNDLAHGCWLPWLTSIGIEARTAQRYIQAYEQFGNTSCASHLTAGIMFDLLSLPVAIDRESFLTKPQRVPSAGEEKLVMEMSQKERREVVKAVRESAGLTKQRTTAKTEDVRESPAQSTVRDVWAALEHRASALEEAERDTLFSLPVDLVKRVLMQEVRYQKKLLEVASRLSTLTYSENFDAIVQSVVAGKTVSAIVATYRRKKDAFSARVEYINPYEILGVDITDNEREVRSKYRAIMKVVHPDTGGSDFLFKLVKDAYERYQDFG